MTNSSQRRDQWLSQPDIQVTVKKSKDNEHCRHVSLILLDESLTGLIKKQIKCKELEVTKHIQGSVLDICCLAKLLVLTQKVEKMLSYSRHGIILNHADEA